MASRFSQRIDAAFGNPHNRCWMDGINAFSQNRELTSPLTNAPSLGVPLQKSPSILIVVALAQPKCGVARFHMGRSSD